MSTTNNPSYRAEIILGLIVLTLWLACPFALSLIEETVGNRGVYGDQYGSVNALFTGLAFVLMFAALRKQSEELAEQRKEITASRAAQESQATAQKDLANKQALTARITALSSMSNA